MFSLFLSDLIVVSDIFNVFVVASVVVTDATFDVVAVVNVAVDVPMIYIVDNDVVSGFVVAL